MPTRLMSKGVLDPGGHVHGMMMPVIDERFVMGKKVVFADVSGEGLEKNSSTKDDSCSDESSSIGKNSDLSENSPEKSGDDEEVQSSYKGPLDAMESLEEVLPIRRGISRFYDGKSKSFASLADASSTKDIAKPDNAYMRKRRNLLACNLNWDRTRGNGGGRSKRVSSSRTTLALAVAMCNSESDKQAGECNSMSPARKDFFPWRSFSLADLQQCASVAITCSNSDELAGKPT